jgi:hypothetical protein
MGVYEDELHLSIEAAISADPDLVINVGCAEGYYAVGPKLRTKAFTVAVDIEQKALEICKINAQANNTVIDQYLTSITAQDLHSLLESYQTPWLILDCEGYEEELLDIDICTNLQKCRILAETHDVFRPGLTDRLRQKFKTSHEVVCLQQKTKDPYQFYWTAPLSDCDKWALVHEGRPVTSTWLWMSPR